MRIKYEWSDFFAVLVAVIVMGTIMIPITIFSGWVTGHMVNWFAGDFVFHGLTVLLSRDISRALIPLIGGTLGFVGGFFKNYDSHKKH